MTQQPRCDRKGERGFTLVELAIVMIIIGLLIGGILKGQELIANARTSATVSQFKAIDAGMSTFVDQFNGLPGDLAIAARVPNCANLCARNGNGDGRIADGAGGFDPGAAIVAASESTAASLQLGAAGILSGVQPNTTLLGVDTSHPAVRVGGLMNIAFSDGAAPADTGLIATGPVNLQAGHYAVIRTVVAANTAAVGVITARSAGSIDGKLDDGLPFTGTTIAGGVAACIIPVAGTVPAQYASGATATNCTLFSQIQQ